MTKKEIKEYINSVEEYLKDKYGNVNNEWKAVLYLLKDNLLLYEECKESIKENGIYFKEYAKKNPLLSTCKDLQATILKQVQHLGLSPYSVSKIKITENGEEDELLKFFDS